MHNPKSLGLNPAVPLCMMAHFCLSAAKLFYGKTQVTYLAGNLFNLQFRAGGTFRLHPHWEGGKGRGAKRNSRKEFEESVEVAIAFPRLGSSLVFLQ